MAEAPDDNEVYNCVNCHDTGYVIKNGRAYLCHCRRAKYLVQQQREAGLSARLRRMTMDSFRLDNYSAEEQFYGKTELRLAQEALVAAKQLVSDCLTHRAVRGLLLEGPVGCGKTHLAAAVVNEVLAGGSEALFLVVPEFLDQLRASYRRENEGASESEIIYRAYRTPLLVLDDLGAHNYTEWVANKLFTILNHRYNAELPVIVTTNMALEELDQRLGERTTSRLCEMCQLCPLHAADNRIPGARV